MNRTLRALVLVGLVVLALVVSFAWTMVGEHRPGQDVNDTVPVPTFGRISVDGIVDVTLAEAAEESVAIRAPARQRSDIKVRVNDGVLHVQVGGGQRNWLQRLLSPARTPRVTIAYRAVDRIDLEGAVSLHAPHMKAPRLALVIAGAGRVDMPDLQTDVLRLDGSGAVNAKVGGRATKQEIDVSGAADYRAPELVSEDVAVDVSGAGRVVVNAQKTLRVVLSGAGKVEYLGNPTVTRSISGAGTIRQRVG